MNKSPVLLNRRSSLSMSTNLDASSNCFEKDLKVDKRILEIMRTGGNENYPSAVDFFGKIIKQTNVSIQITSTFRDRQGNEIPVVKVKSINQKCLETACALIMERLDPHRDKMTFNIDVPYNDHSYIIGKDGARIKQLSRDTSCHIHLPDCNKTSCKKSNKLSIAGTSFESIEKARNSIRKSLPLNIGFKAKIKSRKFVYIDTASSEVQAIKRKYRVDVTFTNVISGNDKYPEVTINVKGGRNQLEEIKSATQELYQYVTGEEPGTNSNLEFTIGIDISHSHHQYVKGKNNCNLKVIHQRSKANIIFPTESDTNLVLIQGKDLLSTVMGWQELMGYLPLLLSFDVNFDVNRMSSEVQRIEKESGVGIRTREKLAGHVYTLLIKTQERHSINLQEIRERILALNCKNESKMIERNMPATQEEMSHFNYANLGYLWYGANQTNVYHDSKLYNHMSNQNMTPNPEVSPKKARSFNENSKFARKGLRSLTVCQENAVRSINDYSISICKTENEYHEINVYNNNKIIDNYSGNENTSPTYESFNSMEVDSGESTSGSCVSDRQSSVRSSAYNSWVSSIRNSFDPILEAFNSQTSTSSDDSYFKKPSFMPSYPWESYYYHFNRA